MQKQQFDKIVGKDYVFDENHYNGLINCKTQQERVLKTILMK